MKRCLILGGAGFIGSHITDAFIDMGYSVSVFDRPNISRHNLKQCIDLIDFIEGDFNNDNDLVSALEGIDVIIHLVSTTLPGPSNDNPMYDIDSNVIGTLKLLELIRKKDIKKFIFISSGGTVYGIPETLPIPESHPTNPICSYGIGKLMIEKYLILYNHLYGLNYAILRLGNPYGERQRVDALQGVITVFLGKILLGKPITVWGDGKVARDYFYIKDLKTLFPSLMQSDINAATYNIGSSKAYSINELLKIIEEVTGKGFKVDYTSNRKLDVPINCLDISRVNTELGWTPSTSISEGIFKTWNWLKSL